MILRIGSRRSRLALWQTEHIKTRLQNAHPGLDIQITTLKTTGDKITDVPLAKIGDKGLFTKELDRAILEDDVDIAVHSLKDVPTRLVEGLTIGAVTQRVDPADILLPAPGRPRTLDEMPPGAKIGTSSLRRRAQLLHLRPDLETVDLRGNLDTRFKRTREGAFDAAILAWAGVHRLGLEDEIGERLDAPRWLPAVGQGALGITIRDDDEKTRQLVNAVHDEIAEACTSAERAFLRTLEGGCQIPIGALATIEDDTIEIQGLVADLQGERLVRDRITGPAQDAQTLGVELAERLLDHGAREILDDVREDFKRQNPSASAP